MKRNSSEIIINFFGTGIRFWKSTISKEVLEKMNVQKLKLNKSWRELLFDLNYLDYFGYQHWSELSTTESTGLILNQHLSIEIRKKGRILEKINLDRFNDSQLLYPLYQKKESVIEHFDSEQFLIIQLEKGLIQKYALNTEKLNMDKLEFQIGSFAKAIEEKFITSITYENSTLRSIQNDTMATEFYVFQIDKT